MLLGAHVSIAGGFPVAAKAGKYIGCEAIQIFSRSPRMLRNTKPIPPEQVDALWEGMERAGIRTAVTHGNYLINLAAPAARQLKVARAAFVEEIERAGVLGLPHVVFHPGAHMGKGVAKGLQRIAESIDWAMTKADVPGVVPLLENTAGQGTVLGSTWEQLREIIESSRFGDRLGVCVDTCHTLAAGYEFRDPERYEALWRQVEAILGLRRVRAFHLNDSKADLGSHVDRHEHIGRGKVGKDAFRMLVNDARFAEVPGLLETPGNDRAFKRNLKLLKSLHA